MHRTKKKKKISEITQTQTRTQVVCESDRISSLPNEILVHILSFLKMKDVVRTSILSNRWRYMWTWNPSLHFSYCKPTVIDRCLDLHRAPKLRSLKYYNIFRGDTKTEGLSKWLRYAATDSVEELSLFHPYHYNYPLSFFECQTLMQLTLTNGKLNLSVNFHGFKSLVTLCLERVFMKEEVLCTLISTCDLLENLEVIGCSFAETWLRISATNSSRLRNLKIISFRERRGPGTLEINTPSLLFFTCRGWKLSWSDFLQLCEADLRFISFDSSWNEDLEGWRRILSAMTSKDSICW